MATYLQTHYAAVRCALEWGQPYLPSVGTQASTVARQFLFAMDLIDTAFTGWHVQKKLRQQDPDSPNEQFYTNLAVKAVALTALAALFVSGANRYLKPRLNPLALLQQTSIPKEALDYATENAFETVTAVWTKTSLENLTTGLFFIRTLLSLYLDPSDRAQRLQGVLNGATALKAAQYRTLEIKNSRAFLFEYTNYSYNVSRSFPNLSKYFSVPVKKVEAIFHLNTEGLSEQRLIDSIQSIYDYSMEMFEKSDWIRYWVGGGQVRDYFEGLLPPLDQGIRAIDDTLFQFKLVYQITLNGNPPPAPVQVRILHEDTVWQSFKGIDIFKWIPQFCLPGKKVSYSEWVEADLDLPLTRLDHYMINLRQFFLNFFK